MRLIPVTLTCLLFVSCLFWPSLLIADERFQVQRVQAVEHIIEVRRQGTLAFLREYRRAFKTAGYVKALNVDVGQTFQQGDTLAQLDISELLQQRQRIQARLTFIGNELLRLNRLLDRKLVSPSSVESMQAEHDQLQAQLSELNYNINKSTIKADFDGVVLARQVNQDELVQPGQSALVVTPLRDNWVVEVTVSADERLGLKPGQKHRIYLPALDQEFSAPIRILAQSPITNSQLYRVALALPAKADFVKGLVAEVTFQLQRANVYPIPHQAIIRSHQGQAEIMLSQDDRYKTQKFAVLDMDERYSYLAAQQSTIQVVTNSWIAH
ncbi:hypothetical protein HMF8227_01195 [Saliniradius amylolyticus]|uniref:Uncharacterized protein n=1 Tax=Saliniradius amylolyticus TaxID=2183582 RepID=A0A2S2E203_9ALTE|nr:efflux RND transporter periplasmic adaptor subunit [Saliniradius amylolyticus]AWL11676.1 hypothetical protein HMF8227_01195 [Saliniradius amylolyticus]